MTRTYPIRRLVGAATVLLLIAGLVALAAFPTGASRPEAVIPRDGRLAAQAAVGDARVLLVSQHGRLRLLVAYRADKGWFAVRPIRPPRGASVAWTATAGSPSVPALSAVYGRGEGDTAEVRWRDGKTTRARIASDGSFLAARRGRTRAAGVRLVDSAGATVLEVSGP